MTNETNIFTLDNWDKKTYNEFVRYLSDNKDLKYKSFNDKIVNTKMKTIGVRTPILKRLAKQILKGNYLSFLKMVKNSSYEETMIEGLVISGIKDLNNIFNLLNKFFDKIDNWAVCDMVIANAKGLKKDLYLLKKLINENAKSDNPWRVRAAFVLMLDYLIEKEELKTIFKYLDDDSNNFYYVMMAKAWLISVCYIKFPKETFKYLQNNKLDSATYNKAISKISDSYRVDINEKNKLKAMKRK